MALHPTNGNHKLWIVTRPTATSELVDVLFQADARELALQVRGGLDPDEILGWFDNYSEANQIALQALYQVKGDAAKPDYVVHGHIGDSVFVVLPQNDAARENLMENVSEEAQWLGNGLAVEHRYIAKLVEQLRAEGWIV